MHFVTYNEVLSPGRDAQPGDPSTLRTCSSACSLPALMGTTSMYLGRSKGQGRGVGSQSTAASQGWQSVCDLTDAALAHDEQA